MNPFIYIKTVYSDKSDLNINYLKGIYTNHKKMIEIISSLIDSNLSKDDI
jgi:hypothetical protein